MKEKIGWLIWILLIGGFILFLIYPLFLKFGWDLVIVIGIIVGIIVGIFALANLADWCINSNKDYVSDPWDEGE